MNTTLEVIDNLLAQLDAEPDNRVLIGIAHDALMEAGRDKEAKELEPRCWLKAKGREPFKDKFSETFFFVWFKETFSKNKNVVTPDLTHKEDVQDDRSCEGAIQDLIDRWLKLTRKRRDELWQWEPPV